MTHPARTRRSAHRLLAGVLMCALLAPLPASAQVPGDALAASLKSQGDAALVDGRFSDALDAYTRANTIEPSPALQYNRGRALQALGRHAEALDALEEFQRSAAPDLLARVPRLAALLTQVRAKVSTLRVQTPPPNATFRLGSRLLTAADLAQGMHVNAGSAAFVVESDGCLPFHKTLDLQPDTTTSVEVHLTRRDESALLRVRSPVLAARVAVDGEFVSQAPAELRLAAGTHAIRVERAGYDSATVRVVLTASETRIVDVPLRAHEPLTTRWWFWAGVAGTVVAASAVVIALSTEKSPGSGDIAPGTVSAPLLRFR